MTSRVGSEKTYVDTGEHDEQRASVHGGYVTTYYVRGFRVSELFIVRTHAQSYARKRHNTASRRNNSTVKCQRHRNYYTAALAPRIRALRTARQTDDDSHSLARNLPIRRIPPWHSRKRRRRRHNGNFMGRTVRPGRGTTNNADNSLTNCYQSTVPSRR